MRKTTPGAKSTVSGIKKKWSDGRGCVTYQGQEGELFRGESEGEACVSLLMKSIVDSNVSL